MDLSNFFDEDEQYTPSELANIFDCTAQTIRNWTDQGKLDCIKIEGARKYKGHTVMNQVNNSDFLREKLRETLGIDGEDKRREYIKNLEDRVDRLQEENEELREEKNQLQQESMQAINKLLDRMESLEGKVDNRLPEPEVEGKQNGSGPSWFSKLLPSFS